MNAVAKFTMSQLWQAASDRLGRTGRLATIGLFALVLILAPAHAATSPQVASATSAIADARAQMLIDPEAALAKAQAAEKRVRHTMQGADARRYLIEAQAVQAQALYRLKDYERAEPIIQMALGQIKNAAVSQKIHGDLLLTHGQIRMQNGDVQIALGDFQRAFALFKAANEPRWQAIALQNIASLYNQGGDSEAALRYYQQSDELYSGDAMFSLASHNNLGNAYLSLQRAKEAESEFRTALKKASEIRSIPYTVRVLSNMGRALALQGRLVEADRVVSEAFALANNDKAKVDVWSLWALRAQIAYQRRDLRAASVAISRAMEGADPANTPPTFWQAHETAYTIYRAQGRMGDALVQLEAMARIDKAQAELTSSTAAALMSARFDFANQNAKIAQLKADQLEKTARLQQNLFIVALIGGIIILGLLGVGLIMITRSRNRERAAKLVLEKTNRELEKAMSAKMEFLATTSHEIRTPLNGILGMAQVMLADRSMASDIRERIGIVNSAGQTMKALVDDILDVAKMETGKLSVKMEPVDLKTIARDAMKVWHLQAEEAGVTLDLDIDECPDQIMADGGRLRQIIFNLLSNAMKFTQRGVVALSVRQVDSDGGPRVRIAVSDSGIGIAAKWHESIFELFQQVDSGTTRTYGGTGLGLAICRNLARAMGGDIWVKSAEGQGSTFTIDLPLTLPDASDAPIAVDVDGSILIVEANPMTRGILKAILAQRFDVITFVDSADDAAALLDAREFEWVMAEDTDLSGIAGGRLRGALSQNDAQLLIIGEATSVRATATVTKPVTKASLLAAVSAAGGRHSTSGEQPLALAS